MAFGFDHPAPPIEPKRTAFFHHRAEHFPAPLNA